MMLASRGFGSAAMALASLVIYRSNNGQILVKHWSRIAGIRFSGAVA